MDKIIGKIGTLVAVIVVMFLWGIANQYIHNVHNAFLSLLIFYNIDLFIGRIRFEIGVYLFGGIVLFCVFIIIYQYFKIENLEKLNVK